MPQAGIVIINSSSSLLHSPPAPPPPLPPNQLVGLPMGPSPAAACNCHLPLPSLLSAFMQLVLAAPPAVRCAEAAGGRLQQVQH